MQNPFGIIYREAPDAAQGQAPQPDAAAAAQSALQAAQPAPDAAAAIESAPAAEPAAAHAEPAAPAAPAKKPWFLDRISQESAKAQAAKARADELERRAQEAEALAARLQAGNKDAPAHAPQAPAANQDYAAAVRAEAERQRFYEDTVAVKNQGLAKYGAAFNDTLSVLNAVGAATDDFVADVLAVNKADAHDLFKKIADEPEKAVALASMNSRQRIAELTRMTLAAPKKENAMSDAAPKPAAAAAAPRVSKAPEPAPRIEPSATKVVDGYSDEASDEEFTRQFRERQSKRSARR